MDTAIKPYKIRYGILEANQLSQSAVVLNPAYGEPINALYGSKPVGPDITTYKEQEQKNQFFTKLEKSIEREGIRNPIFCLSIEQGTFCRYGTTRLWVAQKRKLKIPCIIADYVERWTDLEELHTKDDILCKYIDKPELIQINQVDMRIDACPHYHLSPQ
jgi:hypothetical protein